MDSSDLEAAFTAIRGTWLKMIEHAIDHKKPFQDSADTLVRFLDGPYPWLYDEKHQFFLFQGQGSIPKPDFAVTVNKAAELVQLFGPSLYHTNPIHTVSPRELPKLPPELFAAQDPMQQQQMMPILQQMNQAHLIDRTRAALMQSMLNYLPLANNLKEESRWSIDECLVTGLGVLWTSVYRPLGSSRKMVCSVYDTQRNLLLDPDYERMDEGKFCVQRCVAPTWQLEKEYGHEPGSLKGNKTSSWSDSSAKGQGGDGEDYKRKTGKTNDLVVYWKIWSKMGTGALLKGISDDAMSADRFGRFVHLVVSDNYPFLINCPKAIWNNEQEMARRMQWETPFWADIKSGGGWPFSALMFHRIPGKLWPLSHLKPALGELMFINWAYSFLMSKIKRCSRDFIAFAKASGNELRKAISAGGDMTMLEVEHALGKNINEVVSFLQHPPFHADIYKVIQGVEHNFEQRTGLSELMYGATQSSFRSAEEANVKQTQLQIRPDDMANKVEEWQEVRAEKEAFAMRYHYDGASEITPIFGPVIGDMWDKFIATADIAEISNSLEYRIEASSMKKPNIMRQQDNAQKAMQAVAPILVPFAQAGDVKPLNEMLTQFGDAIGMDMSNIQISPPPPPPQPADPSQEQAQDMTHKEADHQQSMKHAKEKHAVDVKLKKQKAKATANGKG